MAELNPIAITPQDPTIPPEQTPEELELLDMKDYKKARVQLQYLINSWKHEIDLTDQRRRTRDVEVNVESLRRDGSLDEDETLIPIRVIDTNILREQPAYINYIKNSRRLAIFRCLSNPNYSSDKIEQEFTSGMTYNGWEKQHYKVLDGAQTHGWDSVEIVYDPSKPLHVGLEHVGHDKLFFPRSGLDLQQSPYIIRAYDVSYLELKRFVSKFGFDKTQVQKILDVIKDTKRQNENTRIYKYLFKVDDVVYVGWFSLEHGVDDWLKAVTQFFIGIKQKDTLGNWINTPITMYPIFLLPYRETEKPRLIDHKGRVALDENKQEAQTAILSGYVNRLTRSAEIHASPKQDDGTGNSVREIQNQKMIGGSITTRPVEFWAVDPPDPQTLRALQYLGVANSEETNQTNFAAMNREDSRKTAKEIETATQQSNLLNSVQLTLFSTYIRSVYSFAWLVVQSQALQDLIPFLLIEQKIPQTNPLTGQSVMGQNGQPVTTSKWVNDFASIEQKFEIRAAGDVDVIQRQELIQQMQQDWPVIQTTALKDRFLADLIKLKYTADGEAYAKILGDGPMMATMQGMIGELATVLAGFVKAHPDTITSLPASQQQQVQEMLTKAQQFIPQQQAPNNK